VEYIKKRPVLSARDDFAPLCRHGQGFRDYVELLWEILLYQKKNKLPHYHCLSEISLVSGWNNSLLNLRNPPQN
jgi:hypothetical protein